MQSQKGKTHLEPNRLGFRAVELEGAKYAHSYEVEHPGDVILRAVLLEYNGRDTSELISDIVSTRWKRIQVGTYNRKRRLKLHKVIPLVERHKLNSKDTHNSKCNPEQVNS
jgi:hypothetical protein